MSLYVYPDPSAGAVHTGGMVWVDAVYGNDSTGLRQNANRPFLTIAGALAVAQAGDVVHVRPGLYLTSPFIMPANVSLVGEAARRVILRHTAVAASTLVTMSVGSMLGDVSLELLSAGHHTLTGVLFNDAVVQTSHLRSVYVTVDNSGAGAGASDVTGVLVQSTGGTAITTVLFEAPVTVVTVGTGRKRGVLVDTSVCDVNLQHVDVHLVAPGSVDAIGVEVNKAGAVLHYLSGLVEVTAAASPATNGNVSQTAGALYVSAATHLQQNTCRELAFNAAGQAGEMGFGDPGAIPVGPVFLRRGMANSTAVEADARVPFAGARIVQGLSVHLGTAPGGVATCVVTVRKNGVNTLLQVTIVGAAVLGTDTTHAVEFGPTDLMSISAADTGGAQDINVTVQVLAT